MSRLNSDNKLKFGKKRKRNTALSPLNFTKQVLEHLSKGVDEKYDHDLSKVLMKSMTVLQQYDDNDSDLQKVLMPEVLNEASQLLDSGLAEQIMADADDEDMGDR